MKLRAPCICAGLAMIAGGCQGATAPARAQWKVYLATDAPIPDFGDQVQVELIATDGTTLQGPRVLDGGRPELWPISFGITPGASATARIRARFYRLDQTAADGTPSPVALIEATATLPPTDGITSVGLVLAMSCFGVSADLAVHQTCDPQSHVLAPEPTLTPSLDPASLPAPGSWGPATRIPCPSTPPAGMACLPGGAYLMGTTQFVPIDPSSDPFPPHLAQLPPFALDEREVTVGAIRDLVNNHGLAPPLVKGPGPAEQQACTYLGPDDPTDDMYPVNCLSWSVANRACGLLGKRLPTEAEWEYASGNMGAKTQFPWGWDPNICGHAIVARGLFGDSTDCLATGSPATAGIAEVATSSDVTSLGIHDLAGNVGEWLADQFESFSAPCWTGETLLMNPRCVAPSPSTNHAERGGAWNLPTFTANVSFRSNPLNDGPEASVGFRCAQSF